METVKVASLGQITDALFEVGGHPKRQDKPFKISPSQLGSCCTMQESKNQLVSLDCQ